MRIVETTEECPACSREYTMRWEVQEGAEAPAPGQWRLVCPVCVKRLEEEKNARSEDRNAKGGDG